MILIDEREGKMLNKKQKTVLRLHSQGKKISEIAEETKSSRSGVYYALKSGESKLDKVIEEIGFAIENDLLDEKQVLELKSMLEEL